MARRSGRLVAALAVVAVVVGGGYAFLESRGADLAGPPDRWETAPVAAGTAARVAAPDGRGKNCEHQETAVAAGAASVFVSSTCVTGAGDETAPQPDPAYAVDALREDGTVERLPTVADRELALNVEAVAPDGTLWALQNGQVLRAEPDGPFTVVDTPFGKDEFRVADNVVDLALAEDGTVYLAAPQAVAALGPSGDTRLVAGALAGGTAPNRVYADQAVPNPRPALGTLLPTVTGITVRSDGTVIVLALDTVLAVGTDGTLRTLVSPATAGTDPGTRLRRDRVQNGGSGTVLAAAAPYGDDVLLYDGAGGRILRLDDASRLTRVAGGTADENGFSDLGECGGRDQWGPDGDRVLPLDQVRLACGEAVDFAVLDDGQVLAVAAGQGVVRLGLTR